MPRENKLTILLYHGVTNIKSRGIENYSGKHCPAKDFERQMAYLKKECRLLTMDDVIEHYRLKKRFPKKAVAMTFDDGFKNNFTVALPILKKMRIPAAFYVSTGIIGTDKMFWVDELEDCINRSGKKHIRVKLGNKIKNFFLSGYDSRIKALEEIKTYCKNVDDKTRKAVVKDISRQTGVKASVKSSGNYLKMSWKDLKWIKKDPLFIIGSHSVEHSVLGAISPENAEKEIKKSVNDLEKKLKIKVTHYSYPEGQKNHYNKKNISYLKKIGILCCPSAIDGFNTLDDDLFNLKRIMVGFKKRPFPFKFN